MYLLGTAHISNLIITADSTTLITFYTSFHMLFEFYCSNHKTSALQRYITEREVAQFNVKTTNYLKHSIRHFSRTAVSLNNLKQALGPLWVHCGPSDPQHDLGTTDLSIQGSAKPEPSSPRLSIMTSQNSPCASMLFSVPTIKCPIPTT